jgi:hypothetical protein
MHLLRLSVAAICLLSGSVHAQLRSIPDQARRGEIRHLQDADVSIDGVRQRLAPGAQIRDESNRVVVPAAVPAGAQVKYVLNDEGLVRQVWILTPAEAAKPRAVKNEAVQN